MNDATRSPDDPLGQLLRRLGTSDEAAGEAYEALRRLLCRHFEVRSCVDAEGLADEVLDRVSRRVSDGVDILDVPAFARGVARLVLLEARRRPAFEPLLVEPSTSPEPVGGFDEEAARCLEQCLGRLDASMRTGVIAYYTDDGRRRIEGRKRLAAELGVSATALRLRMLRLRLSLEHCVRGCVGSRVGRNTPAPGNTVL